MFRAIRAGFSRIPHPRLFTCSTVCACVVCARLVCCTVFAYTPAARVSGSSARRPRRESWIRNAATVVEVCGLVNSRHAPSGVAARCSAVSTCEGKLVMIEQVRGGMEGCKCLASRGPDRQFGEQGCIPARGPLKSVCFGAPISSFLCKGVTAHNAYI